MIWNKEDRLELVKYLQKETDKLMNMRFLPNNHNEKDIIIQEKKVKLLNSYITDTYKKETY